MPNTYVIRGVFRHEIGDAKDVTYEERMVLFTGDSQSDALRKAEREFEEYARLNNANDCGILQLFEIDNSIQEGTEVFSLMRRSTLETEEYVDKFFCTGDECLGDQARRDRFENLPGEPE